MHGMLFVELKKYVNVKLGDGAFDTLLGAAGMDGRVFTPTREYPDGDMAQLVSTASRLTGAPAAAILEDFGSHLVPGLLGMYRALIRPEWGALDVIEHTEGTIHKAVRASTGIATPPVLQTTRVSPTELRLTYSSARKLCPVAKGIARGVATHYGETLRISESRCMHQGASSCELTFAVA